MTVDLLAPLPLLTADLPGIGGRIKVQPEDFEVEEVPAYSPSGQGDFLYLWVEKRSMGAEFFIRQVARRLGIPTEEVGTAGMKDRHAITRQMVSVPTSAEPALGALEGDGIHVLSVDRHSNKLRPGHLRGNRFRILIRDVAPETPERLPSLLSVLREKGMPSFYGPQRFGREGETLRIGLDLLMGQGGRRVGAFLRRLALSAVQSALFNRYVARRMADGLLHRVLSGDVLMKWPFGGMFTCRDVPTDQTRMDAREIIPGGPMFGRKMFPAEDEGLVREQATLHEAGLTLDQFAGFGKLLAGTRRYTLVHVPDLEGQMEPEGVRLSFTLPAGCYATVLVRELTHSEGAAEEDAD